MDTLNPILVIIASQPQFAALLIASLGAFAVSAGTPVHIPGVATGQNPAS